MNSPSQRLSNLRSELLKNNLDAYIIPSSDPHLGEYVPDHWRVINWLTGFSGSAATVVVTDNFAGLWTDSRYFIQAEKQLTGSGFSLCKTGLPGVPDYVKWLDESIREGGTIGFDPLVFSINQKRNLEKAIKSKQISIKTDCDLISEIWNDRMKSLSEKAFDHPTEFNGKDRIRKIAEVRGQMKKMNADYQLLTAPEDIMWLLNIRGKDLTYSPLLLSFSIVGEDQVLLFADEDKIPFTLAKEFDKAGIVLLPYEETDAVLATLSSELSILIDPSRTSVKLYESIPAGMKILEDISIPGRMKAIKNKVELNNIEKVMIKDGIALTKFFHWFENRPEDELTEYEIAEKLYEFRGLNEFFLGNSFQTIVAYGKNGALPHYSPLQGSDSVILKDNLLLIDSGGQYLDGTTDITRTISTGPITDGLRKDFTMVLKGVIALSSAKFPAGTRGNQLDILARTNLWNNGLNYGHGTGHGVGFCLNVHEGPQSISPVSSIGSNTVIEPGMLTSVEPALYREGKYGIRTENLVVCYEDEETEFGTFLKFYTATLCYIERSLIDPLLLNGFEINWLDNYHSEVYDKISPFLDSKEASWLKKKTEPL